MLIKNNHLVSPSVGNLMHGYRQFQGYFSSIAVTVTSVNVSCIHNICQALPMDVDIGVISMTDNMLIS